MDVDYALVGGGLQNGLIALAIRHHQPSARIAMIERGPAPGGNHTWCFHAGDLPAGADAWIAPLVVAQWPGYHVAFPEHCRHLDAPYACVSSDRLAEHVRAALAVDGSALHVLTSAVTVGANAIVARRDTGEVLAIRARAVIDARGPDHRGDEPCGWQKFVGLELRTAAPHGLTEPVLMDATVPQVDGFRFMYVLPLAPDRLLVEDTYFSDGTHLDATAIRGEILRYAEARGWTVATIEREETGVLPLPWDGTRPSTTAPLVAGYAGGWFHPVTGYSFPIAARLAAFIAARDAGELHGRALDGLAAEQARQQQFAYGLNKMLFRWFPPDQRRNVLERFYKLPEPVVRRFYALEMRRFDQARILVGRPPRGMSWRAALGGEASW